MRLLIAIILIGILALLSSGCAPPAVAPTPISPPDPTLPPGAISWKDAKHYISETATVYGTIVDTTWDTYSRGNPTFLNIGRAYPSPERVTVYIREYYRKNFDKPPEKYYLGKTVCVHGLIEEYGGIAQIEVKYPSQIEELEP